MTQKIGLEALFQDAQFRAGIANYTKKVQEAAKDTDKAAGDITKDTDKIGKSWSDAASEVGKAAAVMGAALAAAVTSVAMTAARTEELGVVLNVVGSNIGKTADEMRGYEEAVKAQGITTQAARQSLIQMVQAEIDLSHATDLARLAQDAAVIAQLDSSQAFEQLITTIQRGSLIMARGLGLTVDWQGAYRELADQLGKNMTELTAQEKLQARINEVMRAGVNIAGTYEAAMETAGKQMRSMRRHVEELANEFGAALLPTFGKAIETGTDFLKWMRELPEPVKSTVAQVGALGAGILTLAGSAAVVIPKIMSLVSAMQALGGMSLLGPAGLVAGLAAAIIYLKNVEKAHMQEAAVVADSSLNYGEYMLKLRDSGLEAKALTQELYELGKAHEGAEEAADPEHFLKLKEAQDELTNSMGRAYEAADLAGGGIADFAQRELEALATTDEYVATIIAESGELNRLAEIYGFTEGEAAAFLDTLREKARIHLMNLDAEQKETVVLDDYDDSLGLTVEDVQRLTEGLRKNSGAMEENAADTQALADAQDELAQAVGRVLSAYEGFGATLASGLTDLRDLHQGQIDSANEYEQKLGELQGKLKSVASDVKMTWEASLPDATTMAERLKLSGDAWDEWAFRLRDIMAQGIASPWYDILQEMGYEKPPDVGVKEWASDLLKAFQAGELEELINKQAEAWQENGRQMKQAQADATASYQAEVGKRKAALQEEVDALQAARDAQLQAEKEAQDQMITEVALRLAEESGALQQWAQDTLGVYSGMADSADEVIAGLDSGLLTLDEGLAGIIQSYQVGLINTLDLTANKAAENQTQLMELAEESRTVASEMQTQVTDLQAAIDASEGIAGLLPEEDRTALLEGVDLLDSGLKDLQATMVEEGPPEAFLDNFVGAQESIIEGFGELSKEAASAFEEIDQDSNEVGDAILDKWVGHSVIPDLISGTQEFLTVWISAMTSVSAAANNAVGSVEGLVETIKKLATGLANVAKQAGRVESAIRGIIAALNDLSIPPELQTESPPPLAVGLYMIVKGAQSAAKAIGTDLAGALASSAEDASDFYSLAKKIAAFGTYFGKVFSERELDPLENQLDAIDDAMKEIDKSIADLRKERGIEEGETDFYKLYDILQIEKERTELEEERAKVAEEYAAQQEKILRLQEAQAQLDFLEQQFKLVEMIKEQGLDTNILEGIELGLDANVDSLLAAMTAAIQAMVQQAEEDLQIGSESKVFVAMGKEMMAGLAGGIADNAIMPIGATSSVVNSTSLTIPLYFGGVSINNNMDLANFDAMVERSVRRAVEYVQ